MKTKKKSEKKTFRDAYEELQRISSEFESSDFDIEDGIPKFKKALELSQFLKKRLDEMENEIRIVQNEYKERE